MNRKNLDMAINSLSNQGEVNSIEPHEDGVLVCKILMRNGGTKKCPAASEALAFSTNFGFVTLFSRQSATFAEIRRAMEGQLDDDVLPSNERGKKRWKFYVPKLGPMSVKQEANIGPALKFLKSTTNDIQLGSGTASNPLKVVIMDL